MAILLFLPVVAIVTIDIMLKRRSRKLILKRLIRLVIIRQGGEWLFQRLRCYGERLHVGYFGQR